jgi:hypothetical protein
MAAILFAIGIPTAVVADRPSCVRANTAGDKGEIHKNTIKCDARAYACYHRTDEKFRNVNCYKKSD